MNKTSGYYKPNVICKSELIDPFEEVCKKIDIYLWLKDEQADSFDFFHYS